VYHPGIDQMILEVQFALKDEGAKFPGVGTIEWIGFPKLRLGFGGAVIALTILSIALANASAS